MNKTRHIVYPQLSRLDSFRNWWDDNWLAVLLVGSLAAVIWVWLW